MQTIVSDFLSRHDIDHIRHISGSDLLIMKGLADNADYTFRDHYIAEIGNIYGVQSLSSYVTLVRRVLLMYFLIMCGDLSVICLVR